MTSQRLQEILAADEEQGRTTADLEDTIALLEYFNDRATKRTRQRLEDLGLGLRENERPLQISLLPYSIKRQSVVYSNPPTRWLRSAVGRRLSSADPQTTLLRRIYREGRVDLRWRRSERLRNAVRAVLFRVSATKVAGRARVVVQLYTPDKVRRFADLSTPEELRTDTGFAISTGKDAWEVWWRVGEVWERSLVGPQGETAPEVFGDLPCMLVFDELPDVPWPPILEHRLAACEAINAYVNDQWANVVADTHNTRVWKGIPPEQVPDTRGPGIEIAVPGVGVDVQDLTPRPQINAAIDALNQQIALYLISEDLPPDDLDKSKQVLTGAALRTRLFGLIEHRKGQSMLVPGDEQRLFEIIRGRWNAVAPAEEQLAADTTLDVELAQMDLPTEANEQADHHKKGIEQGTLSTLEAVMRERGVDREEAARILEQIRRDETEATGQLDQSTVLNGAQVSSFVDVLVKVNEGSIARESAIVILKAAFGLDDATAKAALGPESFVARISAAFDAATQGPAAKGPSANDQSTPAPPASAGPPATANAAANE